MLPSACAKNIFLNNFFMKLGIISDIHGNHFAVRKVLSAMKRHKIERILVIGDIVGYYYYPEKVLELLQKWDFDFVKGNHEIMLEKSLKDKKYRQAVQKKFGHGIDFAISKLKNKDLIRLIRSPMEKIINLDGLKIMISHTSSWNNVLRLYPDSDKKLYDRFSKYNVDYIFIGHSHYAFIKKLKNISLINVGSVGQLRSHGGEASWCFFDTKTRGISMHYEKYDVSQIVKDVIKTDKSLPYLKNVLTRNNR